MPETLEPAVYNMITKKISSRLLSLAKSALAALVLPVFLIYVLVAKPDYAIMNGLAHVVVPAAKWVGNVLTWPVHLVGDTVSGIRELSTLREENEELRVRLDDALRRKNECDIAVAENQKLTQELDLSRATPKKSIVAEVVHNNKAFHHNTFFINKGYDSDIAEGMAVVSFDGMLVGIVSDVASDYSKVRSITDSKSNIPVRFAGSEVYGFLQGSGSDIPHLGFLSDPEFQVTPGLRLVTSGIRGVLPDGIMVGETLNSTDARVLKVSKVSGVMVLKFDNKDKYK